MRRLLDLFGRRGTPVLPPFEAPIAPERPLAVVGDVHGRDDLLARLLDRLGTEAPDHSVILVGDLIDRGEESAAVLRRLAARPDLVVLMGNHEGMLLDYLDDPVTHGAQWMRNGGLQTLASFGVGNLTQASGPEALAVARNRLALAMGDDLIDWLRARPLACRSGNVAVTHAGGDPTRPIEDQSEDSLLWGDPRFGRVPRTDGVWVARGHIIEREAFAEDGVIAVDTGAFATGRLTAALIEDGSVRFLST